MRQAAYLDFLITEYRQRLLRIQTSQRKAELDAVLLTMRENVEYLSGFRVVSWRLPDKRFWLVVPVVGEPVLTVDSVHEANATATSWVDDIRIWGKDGRSYIDHIVDIFRDFKLLQSTVGMELGCSSIVHMSQNDFADIKSRLGEVKFVDATRTLAEVRMVKSPDEALRILKACEITCEGFKVGFKSIKVGMTEYEILNIIVREFLRLGGDSAYYSTNPGYLACNAGRPSQVNPYPTACKIKQGDFIQIDGGAVYKGYCADILRNAYIGEPPAQVIEYAEGCRVILEDGLAAIKPGVTSREIVKNVQKITKEIGYLGKQRMLMDAISIERGSMIGHGIGVTVHELPFICPNDETVWQEGMCGALEIAIGDREYGYVQWEDNFLVTKRGVNILSPTEKTLWVIE